MKARQMRRQARRMSRNGIQPMMLITSDDQLPDMIGVLIGRWLWRYAPNSPPSTPPTTPHSPAGSYTGRILDGGLAFSRPRWSAQPCSYTSVPDSV